MLCNDEMRKGILSRLRGYRYEHSLGVERAAKWLARKYGGERKKQRLPPYCTTLQSIFLRRNS